jgi:hypothetical protein
LLLLARKLGGAAGRLMLPKAVQHPVEAARGKLADAGSDTAKSGRRLRKRAEKALDQAAPSTKKVQKNLKKSAGKAGKKAGKKLSH